MLRKIKDYIFGGRRTIDFFIEEQEPLQIMVGKS